MFKTMSLTPTHSLLPLGDVSGRAFESLSFLFVTHHSTSVNHTNDLPLLQNFTAQNMQ